MERRVKELEQQLASSLTPQDSQNEASHHWDQEAVDIPLVDEFVAPENVANTPPPVPADMVIPIDPLPRQKPDNLSEELRLLSLEAVAERYLGSSSGLSFAKLTQTVLHRLSPDQDGFVFGENSGESDEARQDPDCDIDPIFFDMNTLPLNSLFGTGDPPVGLAVCEDTDADAMELARLEPGHISYLLEFYFAHSHTLYPIIRKTDVEEVLWRIFADPLDPLAQSPLWQFRVWMILAIGSTTYCSVSLMDETEPVRFFNKAMTYFEPAMGCGDLVGVLSLVAMIMANENKAGLEVLMLQVSYSFFNKIGPSM